MSQASDSVYQHTSKFIKKSFIDLGLLLDKEEISTLQTQRNINFQLSTINYKNSLGSVTTPRIAVAAAVSGLASIVRAPGP